jgi:hypothetical protein
MSEKTEWKKFGEPIDLVAEVEKALGYKHDEPFEEPEEEEPKYTPMSNDEHGTIEARDNYEKWYYKKYVKHCHENNCAGCDYCVPYDETMNGRYEGYEQAMKNKAKASKIEAENSKPKIVWDSSIRRYVDINNGRLADGGNDGDSK